MFSQLEKDLEHFIVVEQDNHIIACAALIPFPAQGMAEVAAIAVSPGSRGKGRGDRLLGERNLFLLERPSPFCCNT